MKFQDPKQQNSREKKMPELENNDTGVLNLRHCPESEVSRNRQ